MTTTVGSTVHPWYKGIHEWRVKRIAELREPVEYSDPVQGNVRYAPNIMELENEGVGKVLWFPYWMATSKTKDRMKWGQRPPMLEESVLLELIGDAMKKGMFTKAFLSKLQREAQLALGPSPRFKSSERGRRSSESQETVDLEECERLFKKGAKAEQLDESQAIYEKKYEGLTLREQIDRYEASHRPNKKLEAYLVRPHQRLSDANRAELASLIETSPDERRLHQFLKRNPFILTRKIQPAHHGQLCISKPRLGCQHVPDFLMAGCDSRGWWWYGVELESPSAAMFTRDGHETRVLRHAIKQVEDWRTWLKENIGYARDALGYEYVDGDMPCYIIVGKRENEVLGESQLKSRRQAVRKRDKSGLFLHHYEWLLEDELTLVPS